MCKGNCKACKHLTFRTATVGRETAFASECDRYGISGQYPRDVYPAVLEEIADARETLEKRGKEWALYLHGKAIVKEAARV